MKQVTIINQQGIIDYWEALDQFTISYAAPDTIDNHFVCLIPDLHLLPPEYRVPGTQIIFSAIVTADSPDLPAPVMGGQTLYLILELQEIKNANSFF